MSEASVQEQKKAEVHAMYNEKFVGDFTRKELDTLRATIARGTNDEEFGLFVQTCVNTGLNPFLNHIHCMVYNGNNGRQLSIQISAEGVVYLARKSKGFRGVDAQMVHENDDFQIDLATKKVIKHEISFPRGKIVGGYAIARHEDYEDKILLMDVQEVEHMRRGKNSHMWNTWFNDMFKKHMLKRVAKEQYGIDVTEEEVQTSPVEMMESYQEKPKVIQIDEDLQVSEVEKLKELWDEIENNVPGELIAQVMNQQFAGKTEKQLSLPQVVALKKFCQMEMQKQNTHDIIQPEIIDTSDNQIDEISEFERMFD